MVRSRKILSPTKKEYERDLALVSTVVNETKGGKIGWRWGFAEGWHGDYVADWRGRMIAFRWLQDESPNLRVLESESDREVIHIGGSLHPAQGLLRTLDALIRRQLDPGEETRSKREAIKVPREYRAKQRRQRSEIERLLSTGELSDNG